MNFSSDTFSIIIAFAVIGLVIFAFIRISIKIRRGGGSMTTIYLGATDEFLSKEKSKSAETIVNRNAGKNFDTQNSGSEEPAEIK